MPHFPMFIDLKGKPVLIIGGGPVALRKIQKLQPYGPSITLIAPEILPEIEMIPNIRLIRRTFREEDLLPRPDMVIAATNDQGLNVKISFLCRTQNIPVNVVDDPGLCTFLFPALVQQGQFSAGICTGGASPTAAAYYKERLQEQLPDDLDAILAWLEAQRPALKAAIPDQRSRAAIFRDLFDACLKKRRTPDRGRSPGIDRRVSPGQCGPGGSRLWKSGSDHAAGTAAASKLSGGGL